MSQEAILTITTENEITAICRGWAKPLSTPRVTICENPFNGEQTERKTLLPPDFDEEAAENAASVEKACSALGEVQPYNQDVVVPNSWQEVMDRSVPFFTRSNGVLEYMVWQVLPDDEELVLASLQCIPEELMDTDSRRAKNLSIFLFVYSA